MPIQYGQGSSALSAPKANVFHALILLSTVICGTLAPTVIGPILPAMQEHFQDVPGIESMVPLVVTMPMLILGVIAMVIGGISDRIGRKRVLVISLVLYAVAGVAPLFLKSIYAILASRALVGLAEAAVMTVSTTFIGDYFSGAQRDRYASLQVTVASTSAFIFNLLGGVLGTYGWRAPFVAYALPLLLVPLVQIFIWDTHSTSGKAAAGIQNDDDRIAFSPRLLTLICAVAAVIGLVFMVVPVHLSFMLVEVGTQSTNQIGLAYALNSLGIICGTLLFGWVLASRLSVAMQFSAGALLCGLGFVVMGMTRDFQIITLGAVINGVGCGIVLPAMVSWGLRSLPFSRRGFGAGAFTASQFVGYFCSPIIVMSMAAYMGSRFAVIGDIGRGLLLLAVLIFIVGLRVRRLKPN
jgi:MFS family permease